MGLSGMLGLYKMCFKNKLDLIKKKVLWGVMIYYLGCFWVTLLVFSMKILIYFVYMTRQRLLFYSVRLIF